MHNFKEPSQSSQENAAEADVIGPFDVWIVAGRKYLAEHDANVFGDALARCRQSPVEIIHIRACALPGVIRSSVQPPPVPREFSLRR